MIVNIWSTPQKTTSFINTRDAVNELNMRIGLHSGLVHSTKLWRYFNILMFCPVSLFEIKDQFTNFSIMFKLMLMMLCVVTKVKSLNSNKCVCGKAVKPDYESGLDKAEDEEMGMIEEAKKAKKQVDYGDYISRYGDKGGGQDYVVRIFYSDLLQNIFSFNTKNLVWRQSS